ncbi:stability/partitioning determinant [Acidisphaera sp. L21]|jgi:hypothetical protein|uniref:stability/partitioning determinant n=1 Tax=Acidisphaera sp. L21 TaxID=1641851 RepID=UPI00131B0360|nr:stability/partitioning determinant [Acidisphaera sp. L21]
MADKRASVFDDDDIDVSGFSPKPAGTGATKDQIAAVAEPAAFRSREPAAPPRPPQPDIAPPPAQRREIRRHRTGRNVQLNLKVRQEDADAFYAIADQRGLVLGEVFQHAVEALLKQGSS